MSQMEGVPPELPILIQGVSHDRTLEVIELLLEIVTKDYLHIHTLEEVDWLVAHVFQVLLEPKFTMKHQGSRVILHIS